MNFDKLVESIIKEAQEQGEFDNLPGKGKPIDLTPYFDTPEDVRMAYSVLKNAGINSPEAELLKEIAELKQAYAAILEKKRKANFARRSKRNSSNLAWQLKDKGLSERKSDSD